MKLKLGIIGSVDTVNKIKSVAEKQQEELEVLVYPYKHKYETVDILKKNQGKVDVLLFSGQVPYFIAKREGVIMKPAVYIPRTGTSVYRVFWQMRNEGIDYTKVSFDTIDENAIYEVINELEVSVKHLYVKPFSQDIDNDELFNFHYNLWSNDKINIAVTCVSAVYERLKEKNVPVVKLFPTTSLIREYVNKAIYKGDVEKIKATQIAVQIVKIKNKSSNMSSQYEFLKLKNKLEEGLIPYTQENFGSIFPFGRDEYLIFSTRGAISDQWKSFKINKFLNDSLQLELAFGIGFGNTVHEAEANARIALGYAINEEENCCYIVDEKGKLSGPIKENDDFSLSYELAVTSKEIKQIAEKVKLSPSYISKIKCILKKTGKNQMSAEELARYLGISVRSGRRILKQITDAGYGNIIAMKSVASLGRPRQIYEILL
ncbi:hypothetical protein FQB35_12315 [Crassaminicella thermophila]|uniref:Transcriptional regulator n=1 Tax=Crassaminicella thermophila TaxID=2599308 RepID=A0A5C0SH84_CRATE|nr:hypothetical protein [Crassaminicella thermophila]QEK13037.1 hypothetical protein FQB35_12315 [Crassaminicella thermophila]